MADETFGFDGTTDTTKSISSWVYGSYFQAPGSGEVKSITWNLNASTGSDFKVAIYNSDLELLGTGTRDNIFVGDIEVTLNSTASITSGEWYWLVGFGSGTISCYYDTVSESYNIGMSDSLNYSDFPEDPLSLTSTYTTREFNVIATYTPSAGADTPTQINIGDSWKEIAAVQINIGDTWKAVEGIQVNIGDTWKEVF